MHARNWKYKNIELSNRNVLYNFRVTNVEFPPVYNSELKNFSATHGGYDSLTMSGARVFLFSGIIYGTKAQVESGFTALKNIITYENLPSLSNRGFYPLYFTDQRGKNVFINAKVYRALEVEESDANTLKFSFSLLSEESVYYSVMEKVIAGGIGNYGGFEIPFDLPFNLTSGTGFVTLTNDGNKPAPVRISVIGNLVNPRVTNLTNGLSLYLATTTDILDIDSRSQPFTITNNGVNIKPYKTGNYILLDPGENKVVISCDNYTAYGQATVNFYFRDTFE